MFPLIYCCHIWGIHCFTHGLEIYFRIFACCWKNSEGLISRNPVPHFFFADTPAVPGMTFPETTQWRFLTQHLTDEEYLKSLGSCSINGGSPHTYLSFPAKQNYSNELANLYEIVSDGRYGEQANVRDPWQ